MQMPVKHSGLGFSVVSVPDCGKLLSLGSNKLGKQTVHGLKCHLENATKISDEESGIPSTRTTCKKAKLDEYNFDGAL